MKQPRAMKRQEEFAAVEEVGGRAALTASELDTHVGQRMRQRREALGVSQGLLARQLGVTFSQVQKYEKGANRIGAGRLYLVALFLGVPLRYFFEDLANCPQEVGVEPWPAAREAELAVLDDAFLSIADHETRRSVLALVCSLAASAERTGRPRPVIA